MQERTESIQSKSKRNEIVISPRPSHSRKLSRSASDRPENKKYGITSLDVWALGITVVIGGQYFSWNFGLSAGVGTYGIAVLLIIIGYICLILCISEISSGLPFAGGSYGLARCTLGNYWGFMLGCSETVEYIFYVATAVHFLGLMIEILIPEAHDYAPITWLVTYIFSLLVYIFGGKYFWTFNMFLAIVSIGIEIMFCFGSLQYVDFTRYAAFPVENNHQSPWFTGDINEFMKVMPIAAWFFVGVEALKETCNDLDEPKVQIPRGQVSCVLTLAVLAVLVYFITVSLPPGIVNLSTTAVPFNLGFQLMFDLTDEQTLKYATILSIPATFATCFGFIMMYGKIMNAMAESKLMPSILTKRYAKTGSPYMALCVGSLLSYGVCLVCYFYEDILAQLFNISVLAAFFGYSSQCLCYILLKTKYSNIKCEFQSPFGIYGAIVALCIWTLGAISVIGFQDDGQKALIAVVIIYGALTVWYFAYAKSHQSFSDEEKKIFFTIHVINHNSSKKSPNKKKQYIKNLSDKMRNQSELAGLRALFGLPAPPVPASASSKRLDRNGDNDEGRGNKKNGYGGYGSGGNNNNGNGESGKDNCSDEKKKSGSSNGSDYISYYGEMDPSRALDGDIYEAFAVNTTSNTAVTSGSAVGASDGATIIGVKTLTPFTSSMNSTGSSAANNISGTSSNNNNTNMIHNIAEISSASSSSSSTLLDTKSNADNNSARISELVHSVRMSFQRRGNKVGIAPSATTITTNANNNNNNINVRDDGSSSHNGTPITATTPHSQSEDLLLDSVGLVQ